MGCAWNASAWWSGRCEESWCVMIKENQGIANLNGCTRDRYISPVDISRSMKASRRAITEMPVCAIVSTDEVYRDDCVLQSSHT